MNFFILTLIVILYFIILQILFYFVKQFYYKIECKFLNDYVIINWNKNHTEKEWNIYKHEDPNIYFSIYYFKCDELRIQIYKEKHNIRRYKMKIEHFRFGNEYRYSNNLEDLLYYCKRYN